MKNKKRINVIDLLVVVVVVVAVAVILVSKLSEDSGIDGETKKMKLTFYTEEINEDVAKRIQIGDPIRDNAIDDVDFGTVKGVDLESPSVSYVAAKIENDDGTSEYKYKTTSRPGYRSGSVSCEVIGEYTDIGAVVDGYMYGVGHTLTLLVEDTFFTARVRSIEVLED